MNTKNLKPFNLQAALAGEPVMLRIGQKAFVRHHETELPTATDEALIGYREHIGLWSWSPDGESHFDQDESEYDIIGMWPKTRIINGFEVPAPETEEPEPECGDYYLASTVYECFYRSEIWTGNYYDDLWLERGLVFLNKEDAIANAKAMLGINPHEEE